MNLAEVMDDLGEALGTIEGLRVLPYWATVVTPPAVVIQWPEPLEFDVTMARGADRVTLPITVVVGAVDAKASRDALARYVLGSGATSVKSALEAHTPTTFDSLRVQRVEFEAIEMAGNQYLAGKFYVDIVGSGA